MNTIQRLCGREREKVGLALTERERSIARDKNNGAKDRGQKYRER